MGRRDRFDGVWPNSDSIAIKIPMDGWTNCLPADHYGLLVRIVEFIAFDGVESFYAGASKDPGLEFEFPVIHRVTNCTRRQWNKAWPWIERYFSVRDGKIRLTDESRSWIIYTKPDESARNAVPRAAKLAVAERHDRFCSYCGTEEGPFHLDHIFPVSRGGPDEASNLTLACQSCNSSKGNKTLREWVAFLVTRRAMAGEV